MRNIVITYERIGYLGRFRIEMGMDTHSPRDVEAMVKTLRLRGCLEIEVAHLEAC